MTKEEFISYRKKIIEKQYPNLNNMQKEAVFSTEGPLLVLAGAGSGKTTVLVNRIANIIRFGSAYHSSFGYDSLNPYEEAMIIACSNGAEIPQDIEYLLKENAARPWQILAITFTNKAAGELKERLVKFIGPEAEDIWASTFHSACVKILRRNAGLLGYTSNFTIYDTDDSKRAIKECLKSIGLTDKSIEIKYIISEISRAKNAMIGPEEYINNNGYDYFKEKIGYVYKAYEEKLKANDAMDFDDLILNTVKIFQQSEQVLNYYQDKFRYILVDEYQDTNHLQYLLVSLLAAKYRNICVVGDDDQSIYRFRGADIENIFSFEKDYPNAKVIRLEQNYRSTQNILDAANAVIANNQMRKGKNLWTDNGEGDLITHHVAQSDRDEAAFVVNNIIKGKRSGQSFSDFAVLYRMNAQSNLVESELVRSAIPYRIIGGHKFYDRKEIKDAIAYLSVIANSNDGIRMGRIINEPKRGIGDASYTKVQDISYGLGIGLLDVMKNASDYPSLSRAANKLKAFAGSIEEWQDFAETHSLAELLTEVLYSSGYIASLDLDPEKKEDRLENLNQLINNVKLYEEEHEEATLNDFLQEIALMTDIDNYNADTDAVVLMTIHSAKGLEFTNVFLVGMEETIFPSSLSIDEGEVGIEEERRLAYVAITRAKKKLYISNCKARMLFGMTRFNPPSRFLEEIPEQYLEMSDENKREAARSASTRTSIGGYNSSQKPQQFNPGASSFGSVHKPKASSGVKFKVGDTVIHKTYGEGVVTSVTPMGNDQMLEVAFLTNQTKKIMANFAKLEKKEQ